MNVPLPMWVLRRIVRRNPWLLSSGGAVSRPLTFEVFGWELTIDTAWRLLDAERERLIEERDVALSRQKDDGLPRAE
jgi:hypothetical protein